MPRGGRRVGAGRKPKAPHLRAIQGGRDLAPPVPPEEPPSIDVVTVPTWLTDPETVALWNELAPLAQERRTLTASTRRSLASLCEKHVMASKLGAVELGGSAHARMLKQINTEMLQFGLSPNGKPLYEAPKAQPEQTTGLSRFRA